MKIVYDREKAIQSMKDAEVKAAQIQQRKSLYITLRIILATVLMCSYVALCSCIRNNLTGANAVLIELTISVVYFVIFTAFLYYTRLKTAKDMYSPAVQYHVLTTQSGKEVVNESAFIVEHNIQNEELIILVDLEDANHVVSQERICVPAKKTSFERVLRTDISKTTFDLDTLTVYKPYSMED